SASAIASSTASLRPRGRRASAGWASRAARAASRTALSTSTISSIAVMTSGYVAGRRHASEDHQLVAVDGGAAEPLPQLLARLVGAAPGHGAQLVAREGRQSARDDRALGVGDVDGDPGGEGALHAGDADGEQGAAPGAHGPGRALVEMEGAGAARREAQPDQARAAPAVMG